MEKITKSLQEPERKRENLEQVKEKARVSVKEKLSANIKNVDEYRSQHYGEKTKQVVKDGQSL